MDIFRDALFTAFKLATPVLVVSVLVGLIISVIQAATQIHEQTLTFVPKLFAIGLILLFLGPWMITQISEFTMRIFDAMALI